MRNKIDLKHSWFCLLLCLFCFSSCEDKMGEYYEVPEMRGNAKQVLERDGNFSIFLDAVKRSGFEDMLSGRGIITVAAPTDEAFSNWLRDNGYSSLDDVRSDELGKIVTYHLVYYSFSKDKFANYRPEGAGSENSADFAAATAGLYFKFRTRSRDSISVAVDNTVAPGGPVVERKIYHNDRFVPVLSSYLFATKGIDAAFNYEYFYPNSTWTGQNGGFNISNASVLNYNMIADNGYLYAVDQVVIPLETVYTEMERRENYSEFLKMYNRFSSFSYRPDLTAQYGGGDSLYFHYHDGGLPIIASEWPVTDFAAFEILSRGAYNVFAPNNAAMQSFFDSFWSAHYSSIDDIPFTAARYLLQNHVYGGDLAFPEEINNGRIQTNFGTPINFDTQNTDLRKICANGALYGLNSLMVPRMFRSVTAPVFQNPAYKEFLLMMETASNSPVAPLMAEGQNFALFVPTTAVLLDNTTIGADQMQYVNTNPNSWMGEDILIDGDNGAVSLSTGRRSLIVNNHVGTRLMSDVGGNKIYKTLLPFQYLWLDENSNKVYSSDIYNNNNVVDKIPSVRKIYDAYNGATYEISGTSDNSNVDAMALLADESLFRDQILRSTPAQYTEFAELFKTAGFNLTAPPLNFLFDRFIVFIPSNDVIDAGKTAGKIPTNPVELADYLKYYFVNVNTSSIGDYPFPGAGIQGEMNTFTWSNPSHTQRATLTIIDNGTNLQVMDAKGNIANVVSVYPNIYSDGVAYQIDGLLEFE